MKLLFPISDIDAYAYAWLPEQYDSRMYLLHCNDSVICVDPCVCVEAEGLIDEWKPKELYILLTHEHADHISGVNRFQRKYKGRVICSEACGEAILNEKANMSTYMGQLSNSSSSIDNPLTAIRPFVCHADIMFSGKYEFCFGSHTIHIIEMPGHSKGSVVILIDNAVAFTGDNLIPMRQTITRLPGGSRKTYEQVVLPFIKSLPGNVFILPGHQDGLELSKINLE